jgi:uncharacterized protein HemX
MSNGITGVATETIGALKSSPILIVMVVLNVAFLGAASFYLSKQQDDTSQVTIQILQRCLPDVHPEAFVAPPRRPVVEVFGQHRE